MNGNDFSGDWTASRLRVTEPLTYYRPSCLLGASPRGLKRFSELRQGRAVSAQRIDCRNHSVSLTCDSRVMRTTDYQSVSPLLHPPLPWDDDPFHELITPRRCFPASPLAYSELTDEMIRKVQGKNIQRIMQTLQRNCDSFDEPASCDLSSRTPAPPIAPVRCRRRDDEWIKQHQNDDSSDEDKVKEPIFSMNISRTVRFLSPGSKQADEKPIPVARNIEIKPTITSPVHQVNSVQMEAVSKGDIRTKSYSNHADGRSYGDEQPQKLNSPRTQCKPDVGLPTRSEDKSGLDSAKRTDNEASRDVQNTSKEDFQVTKSETLNGSPPADFVPMRTEERTQPSASWTVSSPKSEDPSLLGVQPPKAKISPIATPRKQNLTVTASSSDPRNDSWDNERPQTANSAGVVKTEKPPRSPSPSISAQRSPDILSRSEPPPVTKSFSASEDGNRTISTNKPPVPKQSPTVITDKQETLGVQLTVPSWSPSSDASRSSRGFQNNRQTASGNENTSRSNSTSSDEISVCKDSTHPKMNGREISVGPSAPPSSNGTTFFMNENKENGTDRQPDSEASHETDKVDTEDDRSKLMGALLESEGESSLIQVTPTLNKRVIELLDTLPSNGGKFSPNPDTDSTSQSDRIYGGRAVSPTVNKFDDIIFYARTFNEDLQGYLLEAKVRRKYSQCDYTPTVSTKKALSTSKVHSTAPALVNSNEDSDVDEGTGRSEPKIIYASRCPS
ncbi:hypothetical protein AAHC03_04831 [Spirometra sp. Aus1]